MPVGDGFKDHCEDESNRCKERNVVEIKREGLKPEFAMLNHCALTIVLQDAACTIMDPTSVGMGWEGEGVRETGCRSNRREHTMTSKPRAVS